jgi:hypothetical protein
MNYQQKRLTEIAADLFRWSGDLAALFGRVGEVEKMPNVLEGTKEELRTATAKIVAVFEKLVDDCDSQPTGHDVIEHLIASYDLLCEEMARVNQKLDSILKP